MQTVTSDAVANALEGYSRYVHYTNDGISTGVKFTLTGDDTTILVTVNTLFGKSCMYYIRSKHSAVGDTSRILQQIFANNCYIHLMSDNTFWVNIGSSSNQYILLDIIVLHGNIPTISNYNP